MCVSGCVLLVNAARHTCGPETVVELLVVLLKPLLALLYGSAKLAELFVALVRLIPSYRDSSHRSIPV